MEQTILKKYQKENYVHCSICRNYRNMNSFAHRKSASHQKLLTVKLHKIISYLSEVKKKPVIIHDAHWPKKDFKYFCHFCGDEFAVHHFEDEFIIESLGYLYHYASAHHSEFVKSFLQLNYRKERAEKFCSKSKELDKYLKNVLGAKQRYLKKMEIINELVVKQIRETEDERKNFVSNQIQVAKQIRDNTEEERKKVVSNQIQLKSVLIKDLDKMPPWFEDISSEASENESRLVMGPTIETLIKHVAIQKKQGLSKNRIGANFKHHTERSSKWLPSYQGVWNKGHRKQLKDQFNRRNQGK